MDHPALQVRALHPELEADAAHDADGLRLASREREADAPESRERSVGDVAAAGETLIGRAAGLAGHPGPSGQSGDDYGQSRDAEK